MSAAPSLERLPSTGILGTLAYLVLAVGLLVGEVVGRISAPLALGLLSGELIIYVSIESLVLASQLRDRALIAAPIAASFLTFALPFGITNALYLIPPEARPAALDIPVDISPAMLKVTVLAIVAAFGMWLGFKSRLGAMLSRVLMRDLRVGATLARGYDLNAIAVASLLALAITARVVAINLGIYGYSTDQTSVAEWVEFRQFLTIADGGGDVALLLIALWTFGQRSASAARAALLATFVPEVGFGILSGFKTQVVMPIIIVAVAYYVRRGRVPTTTFVAMAIAIVVAYQLIQPFRSLRYQDSAFSGRSVGEIVEGLVAAQAAPNAGDGTDSFDAFFSTASRMHGTYIASQGVDYADQLQGKLPDDAPNFLGDIVLGPLSAVVPRFLWPDKPTGTIGGWYRREVLGVDDDTSVGMSPMTYLYLGGGYLAVLLGFVGVGILQRAAMSVAAEGSGGMVIYLGLFSSLVQVDSAFNTIFVVLIRAAILLWLVQWFTLRR